MNGQRREQDHAWHEAAHAAVGCYLGLRCKGVRVTSGEPEQKGFAEFLTPPSMRMAVGVMLAAGPAADRLRGLKSRARSRGGDFDLLEEMFMPREIAMLLDLATAYLVGPCAATWKSIADVLCDRDLTGAEVNAFVRHGSLLEP